ncbi:biotin--[acetyl-CoA-carboxylase] ligase, partial [bacterium]
GDALRERIAAGGNAAVDLLSLVAEPPSRVVLASRLVADGVDAIDAWERDGFDPLREQWQRYDALAGRRVVVRGAGAGADREGIARGVDAEGALLIDAGGPLQRCVAGEVSVRAA